MQSTFIKCPLNNVLWYKTANKWHETIIQRSSLKSKLRGNWFYEPIAQLTE